MTSAAPAEGRPDPAPQTAGAQGTPSSFLMSGWSRTIVESIAFRPARDDVDGADVPHDDLAARQQLYVRGRYRRGTVFEAVATVLVDYGWFHPEVSPTGAGSGRHEIDAEMREAFAGFSWPALDVRVGLQRIAWGHADFFSPNDVASARDIRDPVLTEPELRHRPTVAVRAHIPIGATVLQLVYEPVFTPDRYDAYGRNWAIVQRGAPAGYRAVLETLTRAPGSSPTAAGDLLLVDEGRPSGLSSGQGGLRLDWRLGRWDVTHYYHVGRHGTPDFHVGSEVLARLDDVDWSRTSADEARAAIAALTGAGAIGSRWPRRHHVGLDIGTIAGPLAIRLDAAYQQPALFYDATLNGWRSPAAEAVAGIEYQTGDLGKTVLVETRFRRISREPPPGGLLFAERDSIETAILARWTWAEQVEIEARGAAGRRPRTYLLRPQVAWKRGGFALRFGAVVLGGEPRSFGDWYRHNRSVYVMLRQAF